MLLDGAALTGFTWPGSAVGTLRAADVQVEIDDGQAPPGAGCTATDPGVLEVVAQLM
jgi:hypothetical protein